MRKDLAISSILIVLLLLFSCKSIRKISQPKIYQPPALGAEYQFDRGLPSTRHPKQLFDPKMDKYLTQQGMSVPEMGTHSGKPTVAAQKTPAGVKDSTRNGSQGRMDSLSVKPAVKDTIPPVQKASPVSSDSSHTVQH